MKTPPTMRNISLVMLFNHKGLSTPAGKISWQPDDLVLALHIEYQMGNRKIPTREFSRDTKELSFCHKLKFSKLFVYFQPNVVVDISNLNDLN